MGFGGLGVRVVGCFGGGVLMAFGRRRHHPNTTSCSGRGEKGCDARRDAADRRGDAGCGSGAALLARRRADVQLRSGEVAEHAVQRAVPDDRQQRSALLALDA